MSKLREVNEKIEKGVVEGYKKMEEGVVGGYKKIEEGAVEGFHKVADKFVDNFLTKEGETVEAAKERMAREQKARVNAAKNLELHQDVVKESMKKTEAAVAEARRKAGLE